MQIDKSCFFYLLDFFVYGYVIPPWTLDLKTVGKQESGAVGLMAVQWKAWTVPDGKLLK